MKIVQGVEQETISSRKKATGKGSNCWDENLEEKYRASWSLFPNLCVPVSPGCEGECLGQGRRFQLILRTYDKAAQEKAGLLGATECFITYESVGQPLGGAVAVGTPGPF